MESKKYLKENGYDPNDEIHKVKSGGVTTKLYHILTDFVNKRESEKQKCTCELDDNGYLICKPCKVHDKDWFESREKQVFVEKICTQCKKPFADKIGNDICKNCYL